MAELIEVPYAEALFSLAKNKGRQQQIDEDLLLIMETLRDNPDLEKVLMHPHIKIGDKKVIIEKVFKGKIDLDTLNFLNVLLDHERITYIREVEQLYRQYFHEEMGVIEVVAETAVPMQDKQVEALRAKLAQVFETQVKLTNRVDRSLMGGVVLSFGDKKIDGSVSGKLERLAHAIRS